MFRGGKMNKKLLSGIFLILLFAVSSALVFSLPITGNVIEISAKQTTITQAPAVACSAPVCNSGNPVDTGRKDSNGCVVYACDKSECEKSECGPELGMPNSLCSDGKTTSGPSGRCLRNPDGKCGWEVISCPPILVCSKPICDGVYDTGKKDSNGCKIFDCGTKKCPENCFCKGDVTTCPTAEQKPVEVEIATSQGASVMSITKVSNDAISIKDGQFSTTTQQKMVIQDKKLMMETNQGNQEIKIMPSAASQTAIGQLKLKDYKIELKDAGKPVYEITGKQEVRLFGIFKTEMQTTSQVSTEDGTVQNTQKPWWSFLTTG